jgi:CRP-like cAMP-binding protein
MTNLLAMTASQPARTLGPEDVLITQGEIGGDLYILESGGLTVERDGVAIASLTQPGTLVGEMSVLLGIRNSATVRSARDSRVRVIRNANKYLESDPVLSLKIAALVASRLNATSALLVDMTREHQGQASEQGLLKRIFSALHIPATDREPG